MFLTAGGTLPRAEKCGCIQGAKVLQSVLRAQSKRMPSPKSRVKDRHLPRKSLRNFDDLALPPKTRTARLFRRSRMNRNYTKAPTLAATPA